MSVVMWINNGIITQVSLSINNGIILTHFHLTDHIYASRVVYDGYKNL